MSSSRPSAFDALMSNARAAAAKNKPQSSSPSPKKRKTLGSEPPISSTPIRESKPSEVSPKREKLDTNQIKTEVLESNGEKQDEPNPNFVQIEEQVSKKRRVINVDESIVQLKKKPAKFDPKKAAYWEEGERVPFLFLVRVFYEISKESGRIVITEIVCNMLRTVIETTPDDLVAVVYLLANRIAPAHEGLELGIGDASIIKALAEACGAKEIHIKKQYKELGDLGLVAKASRSSQPLMRKPQPLTVAKVFDTFKVIAKESGKDSQDKKKNHIKGLLVAATDCEPQYLIRLLQIHYLEDGTVQIYSRNAERNTEKFPDVVVAASSGVKMGQSDGFEDGSIQKLLKLVLPSDFSYNLALLKNYFFDVNHIGRSMMFQLAPYFPHMQITMATSYESSFVAANYESSIVPLCSSRRKRRLYESFEEEPGYFQLATAITSNDLEEIQTFLDTAVNASCEGLIIKTLNRDATYEPAKRSNNWLKLKKDYMDSIGDSLDLVPIAAFHGRGKRVGVYGAFLLACYDNNKDEYQTICKIGTGFSEAMLEERSTSLRSKVIPKPKVWEVKAADLTISPVYCAAIGAVDPNKEISLRFPR
ncbi:hypothetical protein L1987_60944 [Smallanthus sonchifolius]|uniref:Uncharacterized protein n=1 Tax=Smallanthus sonchifolius TaxID=185202 RepID=A0ACB9DA38_9ASTR|nr:hypothetical protein L1987_60944 [Smallanthus sonchifolius]